MNEPRGVAHDISQFTLPDGRGERFSGYGVIGLPLSSGHILALRRFEASSAGAAYTSVWHRDPHGRWTFHQNVPPEQSCPRYFGAAITENTTEAIRIDWMDNRRFCVAVEAPGRIAWEVRLTPTPATRMMNAAARVMALLVAGEAVRDLHNGGRSAMDPRRGPHEPDRPYSEWPCVQSDSAKRLVHRGEPRHDTRGRCGHTGAASGTGDAG